MLIGDVHKYRWVAFIDADEFLWPLIEGFTDLSRNIEIITNRHKYSETAECILVHWRWFSSVEIYEWQPGITARRFSKSGPNEHVKAIARTDALWSMENVHFPTFTTENPFIVNSAGDRLDQASAMLP